MNYLTNVTSPFPETWEAPGFYATLGAGCGLAVGTALAPAVALTMGCASCLTGGRDPDRVGCLSASGFIAVTTFTGWYMGALKDQVNELSLQILG